MAAPAVARKLGHELELVTFASFKAFRALAWDGDVLYASRGYELYRTQINSDASAVKWQFIAVYHAGLPRNLTSQFRLTSRLFRDGFHALAVLPSGDLVGAVPRAIVTLAPGDKQFRVSHRIGRGTRPLHIATSHAGHLFWGEYFDNPNRDEAHIYGSSDRGLTWNVVFTFPRGKVRHIHNIVYDEWGKCFWVLTGDEGRECQILRASADFRSLDVVLSGGQQTRSAALVPAAHGVYFSSDTPSETNHVYSLDHRGNLSVVADLPSSSSYGCRVGDAVFFSTMAEPSRINAENDVSLFGGLEGRDWQQLRHWKKDHWPMGLFQYGNAFLPDGNNATHVLAVTTVAVKDRDCELTLLSLPC